MRVLVVLNRGIRMGHGKAAAQVAHGIIGLKQQLRKQCSPAAADLLLRQWVADDCPMLIMSAPSLTHFQALADDVDDVQEALAERCSEQQLGYVLIADAGLTQIAAGSQTVLAVGPAPDSILHPFCRGLVLVE